jgi:diguanylate cyclase (GGDEF)-like protein
MATNFKRQLFYRRIDQIDKRLFFVLIFCLECYILGLDYITTPVLPPFTPFYLAPIIIASFFLNNKQAYFIALVATVGGLLVYQRLTANFNLFLIGYGLLSNTAIFFTVTFLILQLRQLLDHLEEQASEDYLTKANTRRYFYEMSKTEIAQSFRDKHPLTLIFIDLDNFKQVNDTQGHEKGDQMLARIALTIKSDLREGDLLGRVGGDEFAILLHQTNQEQAKIIIERMRENLRNAIETFKTKVTFSIGVVTYLAEKPTSIDELMALADRAMYSIKETNKNSIRFVAV